MSSSILNLKLEIRKILGSRIQLNSVRVYITTSSFGSTSIIIINFRFLRVFISFIMFSF